MSGKGTFHIEGTDYPLLEGDILIMDNTESHYIELDPHYPYERMVLSFKKDFVKKIDKSGKLLEVFEKRLPGKNNLFRKENFDSRLYMMLLSNIKSGIEKNPIKVETNFFALLSEISEAFNKNSLDKTANEDTLINLIVSYIIENLEKPLTLDDICKEFFLSKPQLCRMFKKSMGSTIWNYITVKRLSLAKSMLESGELPTKVFFKCGFSTYSSFFRAYKKHFKSSPKTTKPLK